MLNHLVNVVYSIVREKVVKKATRSKQWSKVEKAHLIAQPFCAACGSTHLLQVHHKIPPSLAPSLELDPRNLITLCTDFYECHYRIGHGADYRSFSPTVVEDCLILALHPDKRGKIEHRAEVNRLPNKPKK